jgi:hypothetical protein
LPEPIDRIDERYVELGRWMFMFKLPFEDKLDWDMAYKLVKNNNPDFEANELQVY